MQRRSADKAVKQVRQKELKLNIDIKVSTWVKDSHGLFDYQANEESYETELYSVSNQCKIYRDQASKIWIQQDMRPKIQSRMACIGSVQFAKENGMPFAKVRSYNNQINILSDAKEVNQCYGPYIVLNNFTKDSVNGFPLAPGNIIKLGRIQYMVLELKNNHDVFSLRDTTHLNETNGTFQVKEQQPTMNQESHARQCKICLSDQETEENPLISPCNCKGSCQFLHIECLRMWINSKVKKEIHGIIASYNFTKFQCQICKTPFPNFVKIADQQKEMMVIKKPPRPYIILESIPGKGDNRQEKCLHLISADENSPVKIGRANTSEIRVSDISVSRSHAEIVFVNDKFYLRDTGSKFGTLVNFTEELIINETFPAMKLQFGRSVLQLELREPQGVGLQLDTE